jgi:hypothetical protein
MRKPRFPPEYHPDSLNKADPDYLQLFKHVMKSLNFSKKNDEQPPPSIPELNSYFEDKIVKERDERDFFIKFVHPDYGQVSKFNAFLKPHSLNWNSLRKCADPGYAGLNSREAEVAFCCAAQLKATNLKLFFAKYLFEWDKAMGGKTIRCIEGNEEIVERLLMESRLVDDAAKNPQKKLTSPFRTDIERTAAKYTFRRKSLERDIYSFIQQNDSGYVIVNGSPGAGKSTLLAHIAKELTDNNSALVIYFANSITSGRNRSYYFQMSVFDQLSQHYDLSAFKPRIENIRHFRGGDYDLVGDFINYVLNNFEVRMPILFVIDALDEIDPKDDVELTGGLVNTLTIPSESNTGVFYLLSANQPHSLKNNGNILNIDLSLNGPFQFDDLREYIQSTNNTELVLDWLNNQVLVKAKVKKRDLISTIIEYSGGSFFYISSIFSNTNEIHTSDFPKTLYEFHHFLYKRILNLSQPGKTENKKILASLLLNPYGLSLTRVAAFSGLKLPTIKEFFIDCEKIGAIKLYQDPFSSAQFAKFSYNSFYDYMLSQNDQENDGLVDFFFESELLVGFTETLVSELQQQTTPSDLKSTLNIISRSNLEIDFYKINDLHHLEWETLSIFKTLAGFPTWESSNVVIDGNEFQLIVLREENNTNEPLGTYHRYWVTKKPSDYPQRGFGEFSSVIEQID